MIKLRVFSFFLLILLLTKSNGQNIDSLMLVLDTARQDTFMTRAQLGLANHYFFYDTDSARKYFRQFIKTNKWELENAHATSKIGVCFAYDSKFDSALYYMEKARKTFIDMQDSLNIAYSYNSIGLVHINTANFEKGVGELINSIKWKEWLTNTYPAKTLQFGSTYLNIGIGFQSLGQLNKALEYYQLSKEKYINEENMRGENLANVQIANAYSEMDEFDKAISIYQRILDEKVFENNPFTQVKVLNNYGATLMGAGDDVKAEKIILDAYQMNIRLGIDYSACKNLNNLTIIYLHSKDANKAIEYGLKALELSRKINDIHSQHTAVANLAEAYQLSGKYKLSVDYHIEENVLNDSINKIELNKTIADLEGKYQSEKKQQTIKTLETENLLRNLEIKRKNTVTLLIMVLLGVIAAALVFVFIAFRKVRNQKTLLDKQNKELEVLNDSLNKMFAIISHDLKNLISGFKGIGELFTFYLENNNTEKLLKLASNISNNADRLEVLLNNLLNWAISQGGFYSPKADFFSIKKPIDELIELNNNSAIEKNIVIENYIEEEASVLADSDNFHFIIRNLLSNAIKFTENGKITFSSETSGKFTHIKISDTGTGISAEKISSLFLLKKDKKSEGTAGEKGTGLGLKLVYDFVQMNGGKINVESKINKGTTFWVELPNS